jgi:hypothetical protein
LRQRFLPFLAIALAAVFVVARQPRAAAEAEVKVAPGSVRIEANTTPVSAVLERLSQSTGMKVVYEGSPPSDRVTAIIDAKSETEAISRLLEGLGLTYAFKLDQSGGKVETLFISTTPSPSGGRRASTPARRTPEPIEDMADEGEPMISDTPPDPAADPNAPQPEGVAPVGNMGGGMAGAQGVPIYDPSQQPQQPQFPGAASYPSAPGVNPSFPGNPTFPAAPIMPGPYSYPSPNN